MKKFLVGRVRLVLGLLLEPSERKGFNTLRSQERKRASRRFAQISLFGSGFIVQRIDL